MLTPVPSHFRNTLLADLESEHARKVAGACFVDGDEGQHRVDFFRIFGTVVRRHYSRSNTKTALEYVQGDDLDMFNAVFPA